MSGLPSLAPFCEDGGGGGRPVVAVAKHLCGVATDLALRQDFRRLRFFSSSSFFLFRSSPGIADTEKLA